MNGISREIWFGPATVVPSSFRVRSAVLRWYRYFERPARMVPAKWVEASRIFAGRIDIRSFARGVAASSPTWRDMDLVVPGIEDGWLVLDVRARAFAWGMVRKIVSALREVESGRVGMSELSAAVHGKGRLSLRLAEPDRLVLWETVYGIPWGSDRPPLARHQERWIRSAILSASARERILSDLWDHEPALAATRSSGRARGR
jgi:tRNA pseudouridine(38-40) synthase